MKKSSDGDLFDTVLVFKYVVDLNWDLFLHSQWENTSTS
jgi:hypothetical protein